MSGTQVQIYVITVAATVQPESIVDDLQGLPRGATVHLYERRVGIGVTLRDAVKQAQPCAQNKKQMEETNGEPKMV